MCEAALCTPFPRGAKIADGAVVLGCGDDAGGEEMKIE